MMGAIIVLIAAIIGIGSVVILKKNDNPIEEAAEEIIQIETGKKVDLTPDSAEKPVKHKSKRGKSTQKETA